MRTRFGRALAIGIGVVAMAMLGGGVRAQVAPPGPPDLPDTPAEADPALELATPLSEATVGSVCATTGGALALAGIVAPGTVPEVAPEVVLAMRYLLWAHGSACAVTPPQYSHTVCAPDDEIDAVIPDDDLVAPPGPVVGAAVETVGAAEEEAGAVGAADEAAGLLDCREESRILDGGGLSADELDSLGASAVPDVPDSAGAGPADRVPLEGVGAGGGTVPGAAEVATGAPGPAAGPTGSGDGTGTAMPAPGGAADPVGPVAAPARAASSAARWGAGIVLGAIALALVAANLLPAARPTD